MNKFYILCGIPFSGKSFLAKKITKRKGFTIIDLDEIKFELFGKEIKDNELKQKDWDYVYQEMYKRIRDSLKQGKTVIHDTGNFTKCERSLVKEIADKLGIETVFVFVNTPKEVAYGRLLKNRRLKNRFDVNDEDFESTIKEMEIPMGENVLVFGYKQSINGWIDKNLGE